MDGRIDCIRTALVVGGGIGGMAAAICLARRGVAVGAALHRPAGEF